MHKSTKHFLFVLGMLMLTSIACHTLKPVARRPVELRIADIESLRTNVIKWVNDSAKGEFYGPLSTDAPAFVETTYIRIGDWQFNPERNELIWFTNPQSPLGGWMYKLILTNNQSGWSIIETNVTEWVH